MSTSRPVASGRARAALLLGALCAALLAGCARAPARSNIIVLLVDTLRYDRLGAYGSTRGLTPNLDALARRSFVFRNAYAQSSWTNPSVASLFTSRYQSQHGVIAFSSQLGDDEVTLAEVLHEHGWATGGFLANFLLQPHLGFGQGFDQFKVFASRGGDGPGRYEKVRAATLDQGALAWLDAGRRDAPSFLYLHYMEPHPPYGPEPANLDAVRGDRPPPDLNAANDAMAMWPIIDFVSNPVLVQSIVDLYDAEVRSLDAQLGVLFGELDRRGRLRDSIVVLLADHGEELLEHGHMGHHNTLFQEVIRVPLMIALPGQTTRVDVDQIVSITDVAPTLLDLVGVPTPPSFAGHSRAVELRALADGRWSPAALRAWWSGAADAPPIAFSELIKAADATRWSPHERAVVDGSEKLITGVDGEREFYDLSADPREQQPEALDERQRARLERAMEPLRVLAAGAAPQPARALDEQTRERMRALGYDH